MITRIHRLKKCPNCNSGRVTVHGLRFYCKKCGYVSDIEFHLKKIKNIVSQSN